MRNQSSGHSYVSLRTDIPQSPTTPGSPSKPGIELEIKTIDLLYTQPDEKERNARLAVLGYASAKTQRPPNKNQKQVITDFHEKLALKFNNPATETPDSDEKVIDVLKLERNDLKYLFAQGWESETVLHVLLNPETYLQKKQELVLKNIKPLLRFLLKICPELPAVHDITRLTPLYCVMGLSPKWTMKDEMTATQEMVSRRGTDMEAESAGLQDLARANIKDIIRYLCRDEARGGLGSAKAIESLVMRTSSNSDNHSLRSHALHKAIENSIEIDEDIVKKLEQIRSIPTDDKGTGPKSCLEALDDTGKTCLHLALTRPFTAAKRSWTKLLVEIKPELLKGKMTSHSEELNNLTPLQLFIEEKRKLKEQKDMSARTASKAGSTNATFNSRSKESTPDSIKKVLIQKMDQKPDREKVDLDKDLEDWLKLFCLKEFDNATARSIMYKRGHSQCIFHLIKLTVCHC